MRGEEKGGGMFPAEMERENKTYSKVKGLRQQLPAVILPPRAISIPYFL